MNGTSKKEETGAFRFSFPSSLGNVLSVGLDCENQLEVGVSQLQTADRFIVIAVWVGGKQQKQHSDFMVIKHPLAPLATSSRDPTQFMLAHIELNKSTSMSMATPSEAISKVAFLCLSNLLYS